MANIDASVLWDYIMNLQHKSQLFVPGITFCMFINAFCIALPQHRVIRFTNKFLRNCFTLVLVGGSGHILLFIFHLILWNCWSSALEKSSRADAIPLEQGFDRLESPFKSCEWVHRTYIQQHRVNTDWLWHEKNLLLYHTDRKSMCCTQRNTIYHDYYELTIWHWHLAFG